MDAVSLSVRGKFDTEPYILNYLQMPRHHTKSFQEGIMIINRRRIKQPSENVFEPADEAGYNLMAGEQATSTFGGPRFQYD